MSESVLGTALHPGDFAVIAVYFASVLFLGLWVSISFKIFQSAPSTSNRSHDTVSQTVSVHKFPPCDGASGCSRIKIFYART